MTQTIYWDGTDQYLLVRLGSVNTTTGAQSILTGSVGGESLQTQISDIVVVWAEYKQDGVPIDTDIAWDGSVGMWKVPVPDSVITQYGKAMIIISGHDESTGIDIISTVIETEVVSHMASTRVVPSYGYRFEVSESGKTITLLEEYANITIEQILKITNLTRSYYYYDCEYSSYPELPIEFSNGVIFCKSRARGHESSDIVQIIINSI